MNDVLALTIIIGGTNNETKGNWSDIAPPLVSTGSRDVLCLSDKMKIHVI